MEELEKREVPASFTWEGDVLLDPAHPEYGADYAVADNWDLTQGLDLDGLPDGNDAVKYSALAQGATYPQIDGGNWNVGDFTVTSTFENGIWVAAGSLTVGGSVSAESGWVTLGSLFADGSFALDSSDAEIAEFRDFGVKGWFDLASNGTFTVDDKYTTLVTSDGLGLGVPTTFDGTKVTLNNLDVDKGMTLWDGASLTLKGHASIAISQPGASDSLAGGIFAEEYSSYIRMEDSSDIVRSDFNGSSAWGPVISARILMTEFAELYVGEGDTLEVTTADPHHAPIEGAGGFALVTLHEDAVLVADAVNLGGQGGGLDAEDGARLVGDLRLESTVRLMLKTINNLTPAHFTVVGDVTFHTNATLWVRVTTTNNWCDRLTVEGDLTFSLAKALNIHTFGPIPAHNEKYKFLDWTGSRTGTFDGDDSDSWNIDLEPGGAKEMWIVSTTLQEQEPPPPGGG